MRNIFDKMRKDELFLAMKGTCGRVILLTKDNDGDLTRIDVYSSTKDSFFKRRQNQMWGTFKFETKYKFLSEDRKNRFAEATARTCPNKTKGTCPWYDDSGSRIYRDMGNGNHH